jgi:hypothetical protein
MGRCLERDEICDSQKFVSKHLYPVTGAGLPMLDCAGAGCEILRGCPLLRGLLLRGW